MKRETKRKVLSEQQGPFDVITKDVSLFCFFFCNLKTVAGVTGRVHHRLSITVI
jgi:hypothetical protein